MGTHGDALGFKTEGAPQLGCAIRKYGQHGIRIALRQPLQPLQARLQPALAPNVIAGAKYAKWADFSFGSWQFLCWVAQEPFSLCCDESNTLEPCISTTLCPFSVGGY